MKELFDILIIGAGGVGCAIARELSRYNLKVGVLEKGSDVADGTSGRNSAVSHAGFNNKTGSLMAKFCVEGNRGMEQICKDLDVPFKKTGKILVALNQEDIETLKNVVKQGENNGCEGLKLLSEEELRQALPGVGGIGGMLSPNTAIFNPFLYCVALAENAHENGVEFFFDNEVKAISKEDGIFHITTGKDSYCCKYLINSAGLFADKISAMVGVDDYHVYPCRGEYLILDIDKKNMLPYAVYPAPQKGIGGLGVHITPTTDGNIIIGPSAEYIDEKENYSSTAEIIAKLKREAEMLFPGILSCKIIGAYSGIRSKQAPENEGGFRDFTIKEEEKCPGLINLIGIESPGLTASLPIAKYIIREILSSKVKLEEKKNFKATRKGIVEFRKLSPEKQAELIAEDPEYGDIVCRCQKVSRKEIRQAIENPLGVKTVSAVKYRVWATTGRCNGGYCLQKIAQMLINDYKMKPEEIRYRNEGSEMFTGKVK